MDRIITLSRQFGSGGKQIALEVSKAFNIPVYDKEIIKNAAQESGIATEHFEKADEKRTGSFLFSLVSAHYGPTSPMDISNVISDDNLFLHTSNAIKRLASGGCVVVGRCGDDVLKDLNPLKIYICAEFDDRVARIAETLSINEKEAASLVKKTDKARASYYNFYTGKEWGNPLNYDMVLNTSAISTKRAAEIIIKILS